MSLKDKLAGKASKAIAAQNLNLPFDLPQDHPVADLIRQERYKIKGFRICSDRSAEINFWIDPNLIIVPDDHPRRFIDEEELEDLTKSVEEIGQTVPACVRPVKGGKFELVFGQRRRLAAIALEKDLSVSIRFYDKKQALIAASVENLKHKHLNIVDHVENVLINLSAQLEEKEETVLDLIAKAKTMLTKKAASILAPLQSKLKFLLKKYEEISQVSFLSFVNLYLPVRNADPYLYKKAREGKLQPKALNAIDGIPDADLRVEVCDRLLQFPKRFTIKVLEAIRRVAQRDISTAKKLVTSFVAEKISKDTLDKLSRIDDTNLIYRLCGEIVAGELEDSVGAISAKVDELETKSGDKEAKASLTTFKGVIKEKMSIKWIKDNPEKLKRIMEILEDGE